MFFLIIFKSVASVDYICFRAGRVRPRGVVNANMIIFLSGGGGGAGRGVKGNLNKKVGGSRHFFLLLFGFNCF